MTSPPSVASDARRELAAAGTCRSQAALCTFARPGRRKTSSPPPGSEAGSARLPSCVRCQTAPVPILHQVPLLHCAARAALATAAAGARPLGAAASTTRRSILLLRRHSNHCNCRRSCRRCVDKIMTAATVRPAAATVTKADFQPASVPLHRAG